MEKHSIMLHPGLFVKHFDTMMVFCIEHKEHTVIVRMSLQKFKNATTFEHLTECSSEDVKKIIESPEASRFNVDGVFGILPYGTFYDMDYLGRFKSTLYFKVRESDGKIAYEFWAALPETSYRKIQHCFSLSEEELRQVVDYANSVRSAGTWKTVNY